MDQKRRKNGWNVATGSSFANAVYVDRHGAPNEIAGPTFGGDRRSNDEVSTKEI